MSVMQVLDQETRMISNIKWQTLYLTANTEGCSIFSVSRILNIQLNLFSKIRNKAVVVVFALQSLSLSSVT